MTNALQTPNAEKVHKDVNTTRSPRTGQINARNRADIVTVACFLWGQWGNGKGLQYVHRLYAGVKRHLTLPFEFVCITDRHESNFGKGITAIEMDFPDWKWNLKKMLVYKRSLGLRGKVLLMDLDIVVVGSLDELASYRGSFATCEAAYRPGRCGGSLIGFSAGDEFLERELYGPLLMDYDKWEEETEGSERIYFNKRFKEMNFKPHFWQRRFPGQVVSWKVDKCWEGIPENARIVRFHGTPRPHQVCNVADWMQKEWKD